MSLPHTDTPSVATAGHRIDAERVRILEEYARRERDIDRTKYARWQPEIALMVGTTRRVAARMLNERRVFPDRSTRCLEVGHGAIGWLGDLMTWGVPERNIHGIEVDPRRAGIAREAMPAADIRVGDASSLPWADESFDLVIVSAVFTSILDAAVRRQVAREITRVLAPGGALLWYDFAWNNPSNAHVRRVSRREVGDLFPGLGGDLRSITLAPPIARVVAPVSWLAATALEAIPFLRTHLMGVLIKEQAGA